MFPQKIFFLRCSWYLNNDTAFIITQGHIVGAPEAWDTPDSLHSIIQSALQAVSAGVPDANSA